MSECWISFGNSYFRGELFHFFTSTGFKIVNLGFPSFLTQNSSFHRVFDLIFELHMNNLTRSHDDDVILKMEVNRSVV